MTQTYFIESNDWTDIAEESPQEFVREVERRYPHMPMEVKKYIDLVKKGAKAGKEFQQRRYPKVGGIRPGDWIIEPYSPYLVQVLRSVVKKKLEGSDSSYRWKMKKEVNK
jgi:hypothetical protein